MSNQPIEANPSGPSTVRRAVPLVFVSHASEDKKHLDKLMEQLGVTERKKKLEIWASSRIPVGEDWRAKLDDALRGCDIAILIVTAAFLRKDFPNQNEVPVLLGRTPRPAIFTVIFSPCAWNVDDTLETLQAWNQGQPIYARDRDPLATQRLAGLVKDVIAEAQKRRPNLVIETPVPPVVHNLPDPQPTPTPKMAEPRIEPARREVVPAPVKRGRRLRMGAGLAAVALLALGVWKHREPEPLPFKCDELNQLLIRVDRLGSSWRDTFRSEDKMTPFIDLLETATECEPKCRTVEDVELSRKGPQGARRSCSGQPLTDPKSP